VRDSELAFLRKVAGTDVNKAAAPGRFRNGARARAHAGTKNLKAFSLALLLAALSGSPQRMRAESNGTSEYDVKAAFLFHFAQFVEWPDQAFHDRDTPLTYCTIGEDAFAGALDEALKGKHVGNRELRVRHLREREQIEGCQVLFIAATRGREQEDLGMANGHPVLTVGETDHFAQRGGIIGFCLEGKKVRFEINLDAAGLAQIKISAKLLTLAKTVLGTPKGD
jgi:hypothetical protein